MGLSFRRAPLLASFLLALPAVAVERGRPMVGYELPPLGQYHIVIKVFPGGERYRAYLLDPHDEDRRVVAVYDRIS